MIYDRGNLYRRAFATSDAARYPMGRAHLSMERPRNRPSSRSGGGSQSMAQDPVSQSASATASAAPHATPSGTTDAPGSSHNKEGAAPKSVQPKGGKPTLPPELPSHLEKRRRLLRRAVPLLAAVVLVVANGALALNAFILRSDTMDAALVQTNALAKGVAEHGASIIHRVETVLTGVDALVKLEPNRASPMHPDIFELLNERAAYLPMSRGIIILDRNGVLLHDSARLDQRRIDLSDRDYFVYHDRSDETGLFVSAPVRGRSTGHWFFAMSVRMTDAQGDFNGVITAIIDPESLRGFYESMGLGDGGSIALYRDDGMVLVQEPDLERHIGKVYSDNPIFAAASAGQSNGAGFVSTRANDTGAGGVASDWITSWASLPDMPIAISVSQNQDAVLAPWFRTLPIHAVVAILVSALILWLLRQIQGQIRGLDDSLTILRSREEALVQAKQSSDQANHSKTQFLTNVSHELRTPLNAIIGFSDMIANSRIASSTADAGPVGDGAAVSTATITEPDQKALAEATPTAPKATPHPLLPEQVRSYAEDIRISAHNLLLVIDDIINMAQLDMQRFEPDLEPLRAADVISAVLAPLANRSETRHLTIDGICLDADLWILADRHAFRQILSNLLTNAVKYTDSGGSVTLTATPMDDGGVRFDVKDTGVGISAENLAKVTEPFHQAAADTTHSHDGIGLGLPLAKALTEAHGGRLVVDSQLGYGTTVSVILPPDRVLAEPTNPGDGI